MNPELELGLERWKSWKVGEPDLERIEREFW
jgi:hypothetical protein